MDEHVPRAITIGLRLRGIDILTVQEDGLTGMPDPILLDRATKLQRVLFSQDQDFLIEASRRQAKGIAFTGIIYASQLSVSIGECVRDLEIIAETAEVEDLANSVLFLPL
jgi:predicted nuclease of predicted toxin-antitoxin system